MKVIGHLVSENLEEARGNSKKDTSLHKRSALKIQRENVGQQWSDSEKKLVEHKTTIINTIDCCTFANIHPTAFFDHNPEDVIASMKGLADYLNDSAKGKSTSIPDGLPQLAGFAEPFGQAVQKIDELTTAAADSRVTQAWAEFGDNIFDKQEIQSAATANLMPTFLSQLSGNFKDIIANTARSQSKEALFELASTISTRIGQGCSILYTEPHG